VLVAGDLVLTESVAIVLYLAEKYASRGLLPDTLEERAQVNRWVLFTATELEQPLWRMSRHTALYPGEQRLPGDVALARQEFQAMAAVLDQHLRGPSAQRDRSSLERQRYSTSGAHSGGGLTPKRTIVKPCLS
jgi:glutathione S-transferase